MWMYSIDSLSILKSRNAIICHTDLVLKHSELARVFSKQNIIHVSGTVGGKTGKTAVLPGFCKLERASLLVVLPGLFARRADNKPGI